MNRLRLALVSFLLVAGCGQRTWEIVVDNGNADPCDITIMTSSDSAGAKNQGNASASKLSKGSTTLLVGSTQTFLRSVTVTRGKDEEKIQPDVEILPGKRLRVAIDAAGKITTKLTDK